MICSEQELEDQLSQPSPQDVAALRALSGDLLILGVSGKMGPSLARRAARAITELGWQPKYPKLEDIVATAWAWHQRHPDGYPD